MQKDQFQTHFQTSEHTFNQPTEKDLTKGGSEEKLKEGHGEETGDEEEEEETESDDYTRLKHFFSEASLLPRVTYLQQVLKPHSVIFLNFSPKCNFVNQ